jgi:hypothetical protein
VAPTSSRRLHEERSSVPARRRHAGPDECRCGGRALIICFESAVGCSSFTCLSEDLKLSPISTFQTPRKNTQDPLLDDTVSITAVLNEQGHVTWLSPRKEDRAPARYEPPLSSQRNGGAAEQRPVRSQLSAALRQSDVTVISPQRGYKDKRVASPPPHPQSENVSRGSQSRVGENPRQVVVPATRAAGISATIPAAGVPVNDTEWRRVAEEVRRIVSLGPGPNRLKEIAEVLDSAAQA